MRITREMDYALRIMNCLAENPDAAGGVSASTISELTSVPQRFTLKILRKLSQAGMVKSFKGANGGYSLALPPDKIDLLRIIESIDGPIAINQCVGENADCMREDHDKNNCFYHHVLDDINRMISVKLKSVTLADALSKSPQNLK